MSRNQRQLTSQAIGLFLASAGWVYQDGAYYKEMNVSKPPDILMRRFRLTIQLDSIKLEIGYNVFGKIKYERVTSERFNTIGFTDDYLRVGSWVIRKGGGQNDSSN